MTELDLSTDNLKLHLGELTTAEVLTARAAIRWALDQLASTMSAEEVREAAATVVASSRARPHIAALAPQLASMINDMLDEIAEQIRAMPLK